jgi:hypothetical protein
MTAWKRVAQQYVADIYKVPDGASFSVVIDGAAVCDVEVMRPRA